jgi:hypothetical protein
VHFVTSEKSVCFILVPPLSTKYSFCQYYYLPYLLNIVSANTITSPITKYSFCQYYYLPYLLNIVSVNTIIFQHSVALVNNLIRRGSLEGATSGCARRLFVCYVVTFYKCYLYDTFRHYKGIIRQIFLSNFCNMSLFLVNCFKTWLKIIPIIVEFC